MPSTGKKERYEQVCREVLASAPGFILLTGMDGPWIDYLCRHYGYTTGKLFNAFPSKAKLVDFILSRHIQDAFEEVCLPCDWTGPPMDVLRSMSLGLIGYFADHLDRHRVFLAEHERRPESPRQALAQQLVHLSNNFQLALHQATPGTPFDKLQSPAIMLLGQLMHAPIWWPRSADGQPTPTTLDAWVCTQLGLLTGLRRPDHKRPSRAHILAPPEPHSEPGDGEPPCGGSPDYL